MKAPLTTNEEERLKALRRYEILDTKPEQEFDDITMLASQVCGTPIAMISLIDENRQWFKSKIGMTWDETSRDIAFCAHGILQTEVFVVRDAQADQRFSSNPLVTGNSKIRFYAGAPLITHDGHALGMLCVNDQVPRELSKDQMEALQALSRQVVARFELKHSLAELRRTVLQLERTKDELEEKTAFLEAQANSSLDGILVVDAQGRKILQNQRMAELFKIPRHIAEDNDDEKQVNWARETVKDPGQFIEKVLYLNSHPNEISRDEIELKDGTTVDRYSSPVVGKDGKRYGRIWTFRDMTERKRMEESLRLLGTAVEQSKESIVITDAELDSPGPRIVFVNPAFTKMTGYTAEEVIGKTPRILQGPLTDRAVLNRLRQNLAAGEVFAGEAINYRKDGSQFILEWQIAPMRDGNGAATHFVAIQRDITERKKTEVALLESDEKFHQLADNIADVFWITSPDLNEVHYISPGYESIWGRSTESLYAHPHQWAEAILPEERERVFAAFTLLMGNQAKVSVEYQIMRPDGAIRWIHDRGFQVRNAAGHLVRLAGIASDITERKHAAEELRESERRFSDMMRNLELVSLMLDREARITHCNDYLLRLTGWQREEVMGRNWLEYFLPPEICKEVKGVHSQLLDNHPVAWHYENEITTRSGARRLIRWNNTVLRSASGEVIGTASIGEDITERKRLEAQLIQAQKLETVGKLAAGVAHEFNSILTAIIGQSELLLGDIPAGSPLAKNAIEISHAAERAANLTRQLLAYGRKQTLQPEILDLNSVLAGMEGTLRVLMGRGADLHIVPATGLKAVKADAGQIEQVIMNMAVNAREAMPNGGKLTLETKNVSFDEDSLALYPELKPGDYVMLAITDTGMGMNAKVKAHLFEPFFTTKSVGQGTGLGLSTCYGIIKQSGGHISVYSEPARGTTFKIYLPQIEPKKLISNQHSKASDLPGGTETILLVEDDPALREMGATLLRRLGYKVFAVANGIEALSLNQLQNARRIDLLFTDLVMPHMGGKELSERLRGIFPRTRILFTSAYAENAIIHQGVLDKGMALLQKPFTPSALAHKVREMLDQPTDPGPDTGQKMFGFEK